MARRAAVRHIERSHRYTRIDGDEPVLIGQHGVEIELAQLRQVCGKLRQLDQQ